ncbi:MAG: redox-regulated ATPase YchF [Candidatus Omnitrophica bacterium]|nr:redox-regulated ATPase YchF [Candidatus Omnitrophota bacterium]
MKIGIIGLPQTGKKTLFELLTNHKISEKDLASGKNIKSIAEIKDPRYDKLVALYKPKKQVRARIDIELLPKIEKDAITKGDIFKDIAETDAICHVVRAFKDDSVYHINGTVDPKRDIDSVNSELILHDLIFAEKRLEKLDLDLRKAKDEAKSKEREVVARVKTHIEKELPLRLLELKPEEKRVIASYPFVTLKEMILAVNVSEDDLKNKALLDDLKKKYEHLKIEVMLVSAKVESEIASLETEKEQQEFLSALGIEEPAINVLSRLCIQALNLISFFTVGEDEVRQWPVKRNSSAPEAAGAIHSDLQKGFIRAEVIKFADLERLGSEEKVKEAGKLYLKGKDYIVEDGDIINIRFNV